MSSDDQTRPFALDVSDSILDDLKRRLENTRWPDQEVVTDWSQGTPLAFMQDLCAYWAGDYDWRAREQRLNRFDQFVTSIDGIDIHFIHQRSPHPEARPLLITHGWPGSVAEFDKVIEPLVDPVAYGGSAADAFHVVTPSLPGFGFSGKPLTPGWGIEKIAEVWAELMARLGYDRYIAQGGDWGSAVTTQIGARDADHVAGIHVTLTMGLRPSAPPETDEERRAVEAMMFYQQHDSGYSTQQRTCPQTVGYGLADSPAGQAAWIVEKFWRWTDCDGDPLNVLSRDELLDNIMLYWVTNSATSSARIYWESFGGSEPVMVNVPTGVSVYPKEIVPPVRAWMPQRYADVVFWREHDKGGHFSALEVPQTYVDDIRDFARQVM